jgi:hypothetical protein
MPSYAASMQRAYLPQILLPFLTPPSTLSNESSRTTRREDTTMTQQDLAGHPGLTTEAYGILNMLWKETVDKPSPTSPYRSMVLYPLLPVPIHE